MYFYHQNGFQLFTIYSGSFIQRQFPSNSRNKFRRTFDMISDYELNMLSLSDVPIFGRDTLKKYQNLLNEGRKVKR